MTKQITISTRFLTLTFALIFVFISCSQLSNADERDEWLKAEREILDEYKNTTTGKGQFKPSMAIDEEKTIFIVWEQVDYNGWSEDSLPGTTIHFSSMSQQGDILIEPIQISASSSKDEYNNYKIIYNKGSEIFIDSHGFIHVVWMAVTGNLAYDYWVKSELNHLKMDRDGNFISATVYTCGKVTFNVVNGWEDYNTYNLKDAMMDDQDCIHLIMTNNEGGSGGYPGIPIDLEYMKISSDGDIIVPNTNITHFREDYEGSKWEFSEARICQDQEGRVHIAWILKTVDMGLPRFSRNISGQVLMSMNFKMNNGTLSETSNIQIVSETGKRLHSFDMSSDSKGFIHFIYSSYGVVNSTIPWESIYYSYSRLDPEGSLVGERIDIFHRKDTAFSTEIFLHNDTEIHAVFQPGGRTFVWYASIMITESGIDEPTDVLYWTQSLSSITSASSPFGMDIVIDQDGLIYATWGEGEIWYATDSTDPYPEYTEKSKNMEPSSNENDKEKSEDSDIDSIIAISIGFIILIIIVGSLVKNKFHIKK